MEKWNMSAFFQLANRTSIPVVTFFFFFYWSACPYLILSSVFSVSCFTSQWDNNPVWSLLVSVLCLFVFYYYYYFPFFQLKWLIFLSFPGNVLGVQIYLLSIPGRFVQEFKLIQKTIKMVSGKFGSEGCRAVQSDNQNEFWDGLKSDFLP